MQFYFQILFVILLQPYVLNFALIGN